MRIGGTERHGRLDPGFAQSVASAIEVNDGVFMFAAIDEQGEADVGSTGVDGAGRAPTALDPFRIGSITKIFTALATMVLVQDGNVDLDSAACNYIRRVAVPHDVTVRDLLRHTSGIYNATDHPDFLAALFDAPDRVWAPEAVIEMTVDSPSLFKPGSEFSYSNTNYTLLGVLIEDTTGRPYHEVVRDRIIEPLGLASTYLGGFENGSDVFDPYVHDGQPHYDYTSIASWSWAAGAMVSSAKDLHTLFTGLFDGQIVSSRIVNQMTEGKDYGLGLELFDSAKGLFGHGGSTPGYRCFVRHSPASVVTIFLVSTDSTADTTLANDKLIEGFASVAANSASQREVHDQK